MDNANLVERPTFILSAIRSGSTLLRCILNSHSRVHAPHELHCVDIDVTFRSAYVQASLGHLGLDEQRLKFLLWDAVLAAALRDSGKQMIVDKTPDNIFVWRDITTYWPKARLILLLRDPAAIIASALERQQATSPHLDDRDAAVSAMRFIRTTVDIYRQAAALVVRYEDLVRNPSHVVSDVCRYLDIGFEEGMLEYGNFDHGPVAYGFGDNAHRIFEGRIVQPRTVTIPEPFHAFVDEVASDLGYRPRSLLT